MRAVVWVVLLFVVAVVAAATLGPNDGLVSFYVQGWRLELSLNLFIVLLLVTCFVLVSTMQAVNALLSLPVRAKEWRALRRERAAQAALREALGEYLGGRYTRAHKAAQRALAIHDSMPDAEADRELQVLSHLMSAASLHRLQDRARRDEQMQLARNLRRPGVPRSGDDGVMLMAAEWAIDDRDASRALALLADLPPGVARRTQALRMRLQAQRLARQSLESLRTARLLAKHQGFSPLAARGLLRSLAVEAIDGTHDIDQLQRVWQQLDGADQADPYIAAHAARRASGFGAFDEARAWLRPLWDRMDELGRDERAEVALALQACLAGIGPEWLPRLEAAMTAHPNEPAVVVAVGSAYAERQLWGKALRPLEQAAQAGDLPSAARRHARRTLAQLAREQGDEERATDHDRAAGALD